MRAGRSPERLVAGPEMCHQRGGEPLLRMGFAHVAERHYFGGAETPMATRRAIHPEPPIVRPLAKGGRVNAQHVTCAPNGDPLRVGEEHWQSQREKPKEICSMAVEFTPHTLAPLWGLLQPGAKPTPAQAWRCRGPLHSI